MTAHTCLSKQDILSHATLICTVSYTLFTMHCSPFEFHLSTCWQGAERGISQIEDMASTDFTKSLASSKQGLGPRPLLNSMDIPVDSQKAS